MSSETKQEEDIETQRVASLLDILIRIDLEVNHNEKE